MRKDGDVSRSEDSRGHEELVRQLEQVREENVRLRGLLGLECRPHGGHETAWSPTLLAVPSERVSVDARATDAEKLALLWSLFGARSDVYATGWESGSTGKTGWSPATRGGWSRHRSAKDSLPLTASSAATARTSSGSTCPAA